MANCFATLLAYSTLHGEVLCSVATFCLRNVIVRGQCLPSVYPHVMLSPRGIAHAQLFHAHVHGEGWSQTDFSHAHALAGKNAPFPTKYGETREGLGSEVWFCGKTNLYIHTTYKLVCIVETTHKRVSRACWLSFFWLNRSTVLLRP